MTFIVLKTNLCKFISTIYIHSWAPSPLLRQFAVARVERAVERILIFYYDRKNKPQ